MFEHSSVVYHFSVQHQLNQAPAKSSSAVQAVPTGTNGCWKVRDEE